MQVNLKKFSIFPSGEIDNDYTFYAVCPYCGYEDRDSWEIFRSSKDGDGSTAEVECMNDDCGRTYKVTLHIDVSYSTEEIDEKD